MAAFLRGEVIDLGADYCAAECGGAGHLVTITGKLASQLVRHEQTFMLTVTAVREDAIAPFGFANSQECEMFTLLRTVSIVEPKVTMSVLSVLSPAEIANTVASKNAKALQAANGVDKRLAERLLVELKDKVGAFVDRAVSQPEEAASGAAPGIVLEADLDQVVGALVGFGFPGASANEAAETVVRIDPTLDTPMTLKAALKTLDEK